MLNFVKPWCHQTGHHGYNGHHGHHNVDSRIDGEGGEELGPGDGRWNHRLKTVIVPENGPIVSESGKIVTLKWKNCT